jgi:hypothetical protein
MPTTTLDYITAEDGVSDTIDLSQRLNTVTDGIYINDIDIKWRGNETRRENTFTERETNVNTDASTGDRTTETITDEQPYYVYESNTVSDTFTAEEVTETNTETETYYVYDSNTNSDTFTATVEDSETITRKNRVTSVSNLSFTTTVPSKPTSDSTVQTITVRASVDKDESLDSYLAEIYVAGETVFVSDVISTNAVGFGDFDVTDIASPGDTVELNIVGDIGAFDIDEYAIEAEATFEKPGEVNAGRATATYPPVPDGYEFRLHLYEGTNYNDDVYENLVGLTVPSRAFADEDDETVSLELTTIGKKQKTRENTTTTKTVKTGRAEATYPPVPDGYEFARHEIESTTENKTIYENFVGAKDSSVVADDAGDDVFIKLTTVGKDRRTRTVTRTEINFDNPPAATTFPPVPNGYDFAKHEVRGDTNNRYIYNNRVGETVQSNRPQSDGETVTIDAVTHGINRYTVVSYDQTQYAELTGDIDASLTTALTNDETTSTRNVDTHQSGITDTLDVSYNIGNSDFADYKLTVDWEYAFARPQHGSLALKEDGQWYLVAIDDPNSPALKHNHIRLYDDQTDTWGAIDVAPVDDTRTIESYRFYDNQTDQWFAPRYYDVRQP